MRKEIGQWVAHIFEQPNFRPEMEQLADDWWRLDALEISPFHLDRLNHLDRWTQRGLIALVSIADWIQEDPQYLGEAVEKTDANYKADGLNVAFQHLIDYGHFRIQVILGDYEDELERIFTPWLNSHREKYQFFESHVEDGYRLGVAVFSRFMRESPYLFLPPEMNDRRSQNSSIFRLRRLTDIELKDELREHFDIDPGLKIREMEPAMARALIGLRLGMVQVREIDAQQTELTWIYKGAWMFAFGILINRTETEMLHRILSGYSGEESELMLVGFEWAGWYLDLMLKEGL